MRISNIRKKNWKCDFCEETRGEITFSGNSIKYIVRKKAGQWKLSWEGGCSMHSTLIEAKQAVADIEVQWRKTVSCHGTIYYQGLAGGSYYCEKCLRSHMDETDAKIAEENIPYREGDLHPSYMSSVVSEQPGLPLKGIL